jgi:hypothetical protein
MQFPSASCEQTTGSSGRECQFLSMVLVL